jgi:hypothetical protein
MPVLTNSVMVIMPTIRGVRTSRDLPTVGSSLVESVQNRIIDVAKTVIPYIVGKKAMYIRFDDMLMSSFSKLPPLLF